MHQWDTCFRIDHQNTRKPKDEEIIDAIISIWYNDKDFNPEKIQKSFKVTVISTKLDGSEQNLVAKHEEISEEVINPKDVIIDDKDFFNVSNELSNNNISEELQTKLDDYFQSNGSNINNDIDID